MISGIDEILVFSSDAQKLADFYQKIVGLKLDFSAEIGDKGEEAYIFSFKNSSGFSVIDHQKIKGVNSTPERFMINFETDDIESETKRLLSHKVKQIQEIYHVENYGLITTFADPDGNYFQIVQIRSKKT